MLFPQWIYNIPINFSFHIWYLKNVTLCQLNVWMGNGDSRSSSCFRGFSWFAQPNWLHNTIPYHTGLNQPSWAHSTKLGPTNLFLNLFGGDFRSKKWTSCFQIHWTILPFLYSQWYSLATVFLQVSILFTYDKREMTDANSLDPQRQSLPVAEICTIDPLLVHLFYSIKYRADATQIYNVCGTNIKKNLWVYNNKLVTKHPNDPQDCQFFSLKIWANVLNLVFDPATIRPGGFLMVVHHYWSKDESHRNQARTGFRKHVLLNSCVDLI